MRATVLAVESSSTPGVNYRVWVGADGPIFCDCRGFRLRKGPVESRPWCRHMRGLSTSPALETAQAIARSGATVPKPSTHDRTIRFIEIVEGTTEAWRPVVDGDLSRFNNLEVM